MKIYIDKNYTNLSVTDTLIVPKYTVPTSNPNQNPGSIYYSNPSNTVNIRTNTTWKGFTVNK